MDPIGISIVAKVAEYTVAPIGRQLGYLFFYNRNMDDLLRQRQNLKDARDRLQHKVDQERNNNAYEIEADVSAWLDKVKPIINSTDVEGSNPSCFNLVQRHQLSRKAKKKLEDISEWIKEGEKFNQGAVGYPVPLQSTGSTSSPAYQILVSRTSIATQIKVALADPNVNRVGVYGMGGVGKTMLLNEVEELLKKDKLFDLVIKVTVGQTFSVEGIQTKIGDILRLELNKKAECKEARAALLQNKLQTENNVLIMLDDLWEELNLVDVGIPCRSETNQKGCKILVTSRSRDVLTNDMDVKKYFQLNSLSEEEHWKFFVAITGEFDNSIEHVAKEVAKECGGLPIALSVVAKALKGKDLRSWKDALKQLKNPVVVNIKGVSEKVYSSLKFSYDYLKGEAPLLFLLCSVFPDDYEIPVEDLQMYAMGMGLLNDVSSWEEARNRVYSLVEDLKSSSLLLKSEYSWDKGKCVKMHDVVRDVAIYIASKEANMSTLSYGYQLSEWPEKDRSGCFKAIFANCYSFHNLPQNLKFKNLELLILSRYGGTEALQISDNFFEGMKELKVLDLSMMGFQQFSTSLTLTHSLKNLRVLCMRDCKVVDIDTISQLKKLEILMLIQCEITDLPATMSELTKLKVLKVLERGGELKVIHQNIFSSMTKLEELDLSLNAWGKEVSYKNKLVKNATLSELKHLPHLTSLRLYNLDDSNLQELLGFENLENFVFYTDGYERFTLNEMLHTCARILRLEIKLQSDLIDRVLEKLLPQCEVLRLIASDGITNLLSKSNEKGLSHENPDNEDITSPFFHREVAFPKLMHLEIEEGNNLKMLWHNNNGLIADSFSKLQTISISECNHLKYIFPSNVLMALVSLNTLQIESCRLLEWIFEMEKPTTFKYKDDAKIVLLKDLALVGLPNLKYVWSKDPNEFLTFPNLQGVYIVHCHKLKSVFPASFINHLQQLESLYLVGPHQIFSEDETLKLVFLVEIVFPNLTKLKIACKLLAMMKSFWFRS